jgi:hypothetical protein
MNKNTPQPLERNIKVQLRLQQRKGKYYGQWVPCAEISEIRLMGKWLIDCGFSPGRRVNVRCSDKELVITLAPEVYPINSFAD